MCRACLSWINCVTAAGWQELMISVAATGLMHLKAMPWCWRAGGGCQRAWNRGERKSTALDLAVVQLTTVSTRGADGSLFLFSLTNQKTHMHLSVSLKKREGGQADDVPASRGASTWSSHSLATRTVHSWVHCLAVLQSSSPLEAKVRCSYVFVSVQY